MYVHACVSGACVHADTEAYRLRTNPIWSVRVCLCVYTHGSCVPQLSHLQDWQCHATLLGSLCEVFQCKDCMSEESESLVHVINLIVGHLLCAWSWCRGSGVSAPPPIEHPRFSGCGTPLLYLAQYANCISACGQLFTEWNEFSLVRHIAVLCEVVHQRHVTRLAALMLSACVLKQRCLHIDRAHYTPPRCAFAFVSV